MNEVDAQTIAERELGDQPDSVEEIAEGLKQETFRVNYPEESYILQLSNKIGDSENGLERLWCKSTTTAKEFYQKHGYEILEETTHEIEGIEMKVFKMEKEL